MSVLKQNKPLNILLIGNKGPMGLILEQLISTEVHVSAICAKETTFLDQIKDLVRKILKLINLLPRENFEVYDINETYPDPFLIAKRKGIPIIPASEINDPSTISILKNLNIDAAIMAGFHRKISKDIISYFNNRFINIHPSLLPARRGGTPLRWSLRLGDEFTGVSAHFVTEQFDKGDVLLQKKINIQPNSNLKTLTEIIYVEMCQCALEVISMLQTRHSFVGINQDESKANYQKSYKLKNLFVKYTQSKNETLQQLKAIYPKTGIILKNKNFNICVWNFDHLDETSINAKPGQIIKINENGIYLKFDSWVMIAKEFVLRGKPVPFTKIVKIYGLKEGQILSEDNHES
jgi:methionyl-tRNA formyltransferase